MFRKLALLASLLLVPSVFAASAWDSPHVANPLLPGYYADPSLVQHEGKTYLYATLDPWGDETLGCWESADFKNWTYRVLNWPTKTLCKSPTSKGNGVWAPSVVRGANGRFYMYVSVRNEVWVGVAETPIGPWSNALGDRPLIPANYKPGFNMIDAEAFIDDDGQAYLYWGSGLNWVNGRCWAVKLKPDMVTFDGEVRDITPAKYFEGPFMAKRHGHYFLMNSTGKTTGTTYAVQYAVGDSPFGPFVDAPNSPILTTSKEDHILGPGHHAIFRKDGIDYILYHRHSVPFDPKFIVRQLCVDEIRFTPRGTIDKVTPTHAGPAFIQGRAEARNLAATAVVTASSQVDDAHGPGRVVDDNYATFWSSAPGDKSPWIQLDLGSVKKISRQLLRPEYAWKPYHLAVESSVDGATWTRLADYSKTPFSGSPLVIEGEASARYLRVLFFNNRSRPALFEWALLQ